jgi:hypothetical protein
MAVLEARNLSLLAAVIEAADPAKLKRFDNLAAEFRCGRDLIARLSEPAGSSKHLWTLQYELRAHSKDPSRLCCEMQDLHASLIADFLTVAMEARFTVKGFIGATSQSLDPELFGIPGLQLRLDRNEIALPDGRIVFGIQIRINPQSEVAGGREALAQPSSGPKGDGSNLPSEAGASPSDKALKPGYQLDSGRRRRGGRIPKPIWKAAETEMMRWLDDNGCPEPGDGGQAALERHIAEWFARSDRYPAESTVRAHVAACVTQRRVG